MMGKDGFKIINVSDEVFDIFRLTGFDQQIEIER
jgi:anti-sigma B factor antagonist